MFGAICGDMAGSLYEHSNIKEKLKEEQLIPSYCRFTDDTVMTCAVAEGISNGLKVLPEEWIDCKNAESILFYEIQRALQKYGRKYPYAGYGGSFRRWLRSENPQPYNSWGNGSAMRVSYAGWAANTLEEAEKLAEISAKVTHNHPEGIKGATVIAGCIFLLRTGRTKMEVEEYAAKYYCLDFKLDDIRDTYTFDVSCAGSVPQAIKAFLEGESFADVIANAISIGGDSDTIAAIAGSIAEVMYPIPDALKERALGLLDEFLLKVYTESMECIKK